MAADTDVRRARISVIAFERSGAFGDSSVVGVATVGLVTGIGDTTGIAWVAAITRAAGIGDTTGIACIPAIAGDGGVHLDSRGAVWVSSHLARR
jgi:hypothetical protein